MCKYISESLLCPKLNQLHITPSSPGAFTAYVITSMDRKLFPHLNFWNPLPGVYWSDLGVQTT